MKIEEIASSFGVVALVLLVILIFADHPERVELAKSCLISLARWVVLIVESYTTEYGATYQSGTWQTAP